VNNKIPEFSTLDSPLGRLLKSKKSRVVKVNFKHLEEKECVDITNHPDRVSIQNSLLIESIKKTFPEDWKERVEKLK